MNFPLQQILKLKPISNTHKKTPYKTQTPKMMDLISCYSQYSTQITESTSSSISSTSCSNYKPSSSCIISPNNIIPSTQTAVACLYKTTLTNNNHHYITITWYRNTTTQGLQITTTTDHNTVTTIFRLNTHTHTHARLFRKKKGSKTLEINDARFEIYYDLSNAVYGAGTGAGAEPVEGYYILVIIDSEIALFIGDMYEEHVVKKVKVNKMEAKYGLVCRKEHFSGNTVYATKARFSDSGNWHDIMIRCIGEHDGLKYPVLLVYIDKRVVIRVKRLQWNFRGNQTIFLDGLLVDLMWDVHDWFFHSDTDPGSGREPDSGSGSESGHAVFMFRTRSGLDSRLWLEEKIVKSDDQKNGFSLLIYATKS